MIFLKISKTQKAMKFEAKTGKFDEKFTAVKQL